MNINNTHSQSYWFVLREDQSNVIFSSNNFTIQNPQPQSQEYIVETDDKQFTQVNEADAAGAVVSDAAEHSDAEPKKEETFWDRNRIKLLLTLCLENNLKNPTKDKSLLDEIAKHVGTTAHDCSIKYKNLRRTFIRLLKKRRQGKEIKWVHYSICEKVFNECKSLPPSVLEPWDEQRVRSLLDLYIDNLNRFRSSDCLQKDVWRDIALQLGTTEYNCYHKYKNLKRAHLKWTQRSQDSGKPAKWPYHHYFERIFYEYSPNTGPWNRSKTRQLMDAYIQVVDKFANPRYQKKDLWKEISDIVGESASNCDKKFRNLKQTYIKLKMRVEAGKSITRWRYFKDFEIIYDTTFRDRRNCGPMKKHDEDYVKQLLTFYLEHKDQFRDPRIKKKTVWRGFAQSAAFALSPEECDRKFRNLKQTYIRLEEKRRLTGATTAWPYYAYFQRIFDKPKISRKTIPKPSMDQVSICDLQRVVKQVQENKHDNFKKLLHAMEEANQIQKERNKILEKILHRIE